MSKPLKVNKNQGVKKVKEARKVIPAKSGGSKADAVLLRVLGE